MSIHIHAKSWMGETIHIFSASTIADARQVMEAISYFDLHDASQSFVKVGSDIFTFEEFERLPYDDIG